MAICFSLFFFLFFLILHESIEWIDWMCFFPGRYTIKLQIQVIFLLNCNPFDDFTFILKDDCSKYHITVPVSTTWIFKHCKTIHSFLLLLLLLNFQVQTSVILRVKKVKEIGQSCFHHKSIKYFMCSECYPSHKQCASVFQDRIFQLFETPKKNWLSMFKIYIILYSNIIYTVNYNFNKDAFSCLGFIIFFWNFNISKRLI